MRSEVVSSNQTSLVATDSTRVLVGAGIPRALEVVLSVLGLIVSAPLIALSAAAIAASSSGSVIFRQERVGRGGQNFVLYKLRTMRPGLSGPQVTAGDDVRVTWIGRLLRRTKLDELPELWNVLKGDMSLVGPRPEVPRYVDLENPAWRLVLRVRPGITDPVTLRLRNEEALLAEVKGELEHFYTGSLQPFKLKGYVEYLGARTWRSDIKVLWDSGIAVIFAGQAPPPTQEIFSLNRGSASPSAGHRESDLTASAPVPLSTGAGAVDITKFDVSEDSPRGGFLSPARAQTHPSRPNETRHARAPD